MTKKLSFLFSVLILSFAFGYFIFAWTEPGTTPPGGNVPAPVNVGPDTQTKSGGLNLGGDLTVGGTLNIGSYGDIYSDSSWLRLNQNHTQNIYTPRIMRADGGLYVSDDERIYSCNEDYVCTDDNLMVTGGGWLRVDGSEGLYFQSYGGGWRMQDSTWIRSYGSKPVYIDRYLRADQGLYVGDDEYFYRNSEDFIRTGDHFQSDASVRAPIFYDSNNTGYYVNPYSTSNLNNLRLAGTLRLSWQRIQQSCMTQKCTATCPSGYIVVGGGCEVHGGVAIDNRPEYIGRTYWERRWVCYGASSADKDKIETTYAICLKIQSP